MDRRDVLKALGIGALSFAIPFPVRAESETEAAFKARVLAFRDSQGAGTVEYKTFEEVKAALGGNFDSCNISNPLREVESYWLLGYRATPANQEVVGFEHKGEVILASPSNEYWAPSKSIPEVDISIQRIPRTDEGIRSHMVTHRFFGNPDSDQWLRKVVLVSKTTPSLRRINPLNV